MASALPTAVKIRYGGEVRRVGGAHFFGQEYDFQDFCDKLRMLTGDPLPQIETESGPQQFCVQYTDEEGDAVRVRSTAELVEAVRCLSPCVTFTILECGTAGEAQPAASNDKAPRAISMDDWGRLFKEGRFAEYIDVAKEMMATNASHVYAYNAACASVHLGKFKEAISFLRSAVQAGFADFPHLLQDPDLSKLFLQIDLHKELMEAVRPIVQNVTASRLADYLNDCSSQGVWSVGLFLAQLTEQLPDPVCFYNSACCFAQTGQPQKAMQYLSEAIEAGFRSVDHLVHDVDLAKLHPLPEWNDFLARLQNAGLYHPPTPPASPESVPTSGFSVVSTPSSEAPLSEQSDEPVLVEPVVEEVTPCDRENVPQAEVVPTAAESAPASEFAKQIELLHNMGFNAPAEELELLLRLHNGAVEPVLTQLI